MPPRLPSRNVGKLRKRGFGLIYPTLKLLLGALLLAGCLRSTDSVDPLPELCNGLEDDNDGLIDEGACPGAVAVCEGGLCTLICREGYGDADRRYSNGCECVVANGGVEACNGDDDDCDGTRDEGWVGNLAREQRGVCRDQRERCVDGMRAQPDLTEIDDYERDEVTCDHLDNDCDGLVDESFVEMCNGADDDCDGVVDGADAACPDFTENQGTGTRVCEGAVCTIGRCVNGRADADGDYATGCECLLRHGGVERCDGFDDDCDMREDEALAPQPAGNQVGVCRGSTRACIDGQWREPDLHDQPGYEEDEATCDGLDNDCDGSVDEFCDRCAVDDDCPRDGAAGPWCGEAEPHTGRCLRCDPARQAGCEDRTFGVCAADATCRACQSHRECEMLLPGTRHCNAVTFADPAARRVGVCCVGGPPNIYLEGVVQALETGFTLTLTQDGRAITEETWCARDLLRADEQGPRAEILAGWNGARLYSNVQPALDQWIARGALDVPGSIRLTDSAGRLVHTFRLRNVSGVRDATPDRDVWDYRLTFEPIR